MEKTVNVDDVHKIKIELSGTNGAGNSDVTYVENNALSSKNNVFSKLYKATYTNNVSSAKITVYYDSDKLSGQGKTASDLAIFKKNSSSGEITVLPTTANDDNSLCATVETPSSSGNEQYFVAEKTMDVSNITSSTVLAIDTSLEMVNFANNNEGFFEDLSAIADVCGENSSVSIIAGYDNEIQSVQDATTDSITVEDAISQLQLTDENSVNQIALLDASADLMDDSFFKNIVLVLSEVDNSSEFVSAINELKNNGINVILIYTCIIPDSSIIKSTSANIYDVFVSSQMQMSFSELEGNLNEFIDSEIQLMASGDTVVDTKFDPSVHGYKFTNPGECAYNTNGGVCAGMALTSIMNFYGMLPAAMVVNNKFVQEADKYSGDEKDGTEAGHNLDELSYFSVLYDAASPNNISGFTNKQTNVFSNKNIKESQIGCMLSAWWWLANRFDDEKNVLGGHVSEGNQHFIPNSEIETIISLLNNGYPVYFGMGRLSTNINDKNDYEYTGHAVVLIGYSLNASQTVLKFSVYDNNQPNVIRRDDLVFTKDTTSNYWRVDWVAEDKDIFGNVLRSFYNYRSSEITETRYSETHKSNVSCKIEYDIAYIDTKEYIKTYKKSQAISTEWSGKDFIVNYPNNTTAHQLSEIRDGTRTVHNGNKIPNARRSDYMNTEFYYAVRTYMNDYMLPTIWNSVNVVKNNKVQLIDIIPGAWYEKSVKEIVKEGYMTGYPDGTFRPGQTMTTAEFVVTLCNAIGQQKTIPSSGHWAENYMKYARDKGWVYSGYTADTGYYDRKLARGEAIQLLWNIMSSEDAKAYSKIKYITPDSAMGLMFDENKNLKGQVLFQDGNLSTGEYSYAHAALKQLYLNTVFFGVEINGHAYVNAWEHLSRASAAEFINKCLK